MGTTTIGVVDEVSNLFQQFRKHRAEVSYKLSASRALHYLIHLYETMHETAGRALEAKSAAEAFETWREGWFRAHSWSPPKIPRGASSPSYRASLQDRILAAVAIRQRLGIEPTEEMIRDFINRGGPDSIRVEVLEKLGQELDSGAASSKAPPHASTARAPDPRDDDPGPSLR